MGRLDQFIPTKRGRKKFLQNLWDENGVSKGFVAYPSESTEQSSQGEPSKSNWQKYARRIRRRAEKLTKAVTIVNPLKGRAAE